MKLDWVDTNYRVWLIEPGHPWVLSTPSEDNSDSSDAKASNQTWPWIGNWLGGRDDERRDGKKDAGNDNQAKPLIGPRGAGARRYRQKARSRRCHSIDSAVRDSLRPARPTAPPS